MLAPVTDWLCVIQTGRIHAAPWRDVMAARRRKRRTVDTVCGRRRAKIYVVPAYKDPTWEDLGWLALSWPSPQTHDGYRRCAICWETTGRKRPATAFRELRRRNGKTAADVLAKEADR